MNVNPDVMAMQGHIGRIMRQQNFLGISNMRTARYGIGGSMGLFALSRGMRALDSIRYRDFVGTAWNAGLAAGAGYMAWGMFRSPGMQGSMLQNANRLWSRAQSWKPVQNMASRSLKYFGKL